MKFRILEVKEPITAEEIIEKLQKKSGLTKEELYKKLEELPEFLKKHEKK